MKPTNQKAAGACLTAVCALWLFLAACSNPARQAAATPALQPPPKASTEGTISAEAVVVPQRETTLAFRVAGRVAQVLVDEGDVVTAGQELAQLDTRDLEVAVRSAEAGLSLAQAQLAKAKAGPRAEDVAPAEAAVGIAQSNLKTAEVTVAVLQGSRAAATAALAVARANLDKLVAGPTPQEVEIAEKQVEQARNEVWGLQKQRDATRNTLEGQIAAAETAVQIAELQLEKLKAGTRPEDIEAARAQVAQAEAGVTTADAQISQTRAQVETAKAQLLQAEAQRDQAKAGARPEDIAIAEAAVAQAEATLAEARNTLADAILVAPFAATVGTLSISEGELVSPQVPAVRIGDLSRLHVKTEDLSEVDVHQVQEGQAADITVDALEGKVFQGRVLRVLPVAGDRRGDKVYTVTIDPGVGSDSGLRWGMTALVDIHVH